MRGVPGARATAGPVAVVVAARCRPVSHGLAKIESRTEVTGCSCFFSGGRFLSRIELDSDRQGRVASALT